MRDSIFRDVRLGFGTGGLGGYFEPDLAAGEGVKHLVRYALDLGVRFFDTAANYAGGYSEQLLGDALRGRRSEVVIATKFGVGCKTGLEVRLELEASMRRLRTDYVDVYQNHWPNPDSNFEDILNELANLVDEKRIRGIGLSNLPARDIELAKNILGERLVSIQDEYNLLERSIEGFIYPYCCRNNLKFIAYSPFLNGRSLERHVSYEKLKALAHDLGRTIHSLSLMWLLSKRNILAIPRTSSKKHLSENVSCASTELDSVVIDEISELFKPRVSYVIPADIIVTDAHDRLVYKTIDEALRNEQNLLPSPRQIAERFLRGEIPKPLKLRRISDGRYRLVEGRLKYWGWVLAFGFTDRPINAIIED